MQNIENNNNIPNPRLKNQAIWKKGMQNIEKNNAK